MFSFTLSNFGSKRRGWFKPCLGCFIPGKRDPVPMVGSWMSLSVDMDRCEKNSLHRDFFYLYQHFQYTYFMSCWNSCSLSTLLLLDLFSHPVCRSMQVTTITRVWVLEISIYSLIAYIHLSHGTPHFAHVRSFKD
jgi:hypothetical protein